jgi:hypothetical protein
MRGNTRRHEHSAQQQLVVAALKGDGGQQLVVAALKGDGGWLTYS